MESQNRISIDKLAHLAYNQQLFGVSDAASGTALVGANFFLYNPGSKGLPVRLISVKLASTASCFATLGSVIGNPGVAAGNLPSCFYVGGTSAQASNQANAAAPVVPSGVIKQTLTLANTETEVLLPGSLFIPPGFGVVVALSIQVSTYYVTWLWAELPPPDQDN